MTPPSQQGTDGKFTHVARIHSSLVLLAEQWSLVGQHRPLTIYLLKDIQVFPVRGLPTCSKHQVQVFMNIGLGFSRTPAQDCSCWVRGSLRV